MAELYKNEQLQILYDFGVTPRRDVTHQLSELYKLTSSQIKEDITSNKISEIMAVQLNNITGPILGKTIRESVYTKNTDVYNEIGQLCHLYMGIHVPPKVATELPPPPKAALPPAAPPAEPSGSKPALPPLSPEPKPHERLASQVKSITTKGLSSTFPEGGGTSLNTPNPASRSEPVKSQSTSHPISTKGLRPPPPEGGGTRLNGPTPEGISLNEPALASHSTSAKKPQSSGKGRSTIAYSRMSSNPVIPPPLTPNEIMALSTSRPGTPTSTLSKAGKQIVSNNFVFHEGKTGLSLG